MKRIPVSSSNVRSVGYDAQTRTLEVEFLSGTIWQYSDVPLETYEKMLKPEASVGSIVAKQVKPVFVGQKVEVDTKAVMPRFTGAKAEIETK